MQNMEWKSIKVPGIDDNEPYTSLATCEPQDTVQCSSCQELNSKCKSPGTESYDRLSPKP